MCVCMYVCMYVYTGDAERAGMAYFLGWYAKRPHGALNVFHTGGSVVGVGVVIFVLIM